MAKRLPLGEPDRQGRVVLATVDRGDPRPVDLGHVGAVGERQRHLAENDRVCGKARELERNRLRLAARYRQLSAALIGRYAQGAVRDAA